MKKKTRNVYRTISYSIQKMHQMDRPYLWLLLSSVIILSVVPFINMFLISNAINLVAINNNIRGAVWFAVICLTVIAVLKILEVFVMWYRSNHYILLGHKFDILLAQKTLRMKYENAENPDISDLRMRASRGGSSVARVGECVTEIISGSLKLVGCSAILLMFHPLILVLILTLVAINYVVNLYIKKRILENEDKGHKFERKINYFLNTILDPIAGKEIRIFSAAHFFTNKYRYEEEALYQINRSTQRYKLVGQIINVMIVAVQILVLYWVSATMFFRNSASIGDVVLYINTAITFSEAFSGLFTNLATLSGFSKRIEDYQAYLNLDDDETSRGQILPEEELTITFENVWYKYRNANDYVLKDINLVIKPREKIALVGENGSGKTTLIMLLMRFYTPTQGRILINGMDYLDINLDEYYMKLSSVFQGFNLLAFTIRENIDFQNNVNSSKEIAEVLERLDMTQIIERLPQGIESYVSQEFSPEGINLSGGERQKLAIARADYKHAPILVLDEPTSALDPIAEKRLYDLLYGLMEDKTVIMISHRLHSTLLSDQIYYMERGTILEYGTHHQLIEQQGAYQRMFGIQAAWYHDEYEKMSERS